MKFGDSGQVKPRKGSGLERETDSEAVPTSPPQNICLIFQTQIVKMGLN